MHNLTNPTAQLPNADIMDLIKNQLRKYSFKKVYEEVVRVKKFKNCLFFFGEFTVSSPISQNCSGIFHNFTDFNHNIYGIGTPTTLNNSIYVTIAISSEIGKIIYVSEGHLIDFQENLTEIVKISPPVPYPIFSSLIFSIDVVGE